MREQFVQRAAPALNIVGDVTTAQPFTLASPTLNPAINPATLQPAFLQVPGTGRFEQRKFRVTASGFANIAADSNFTAQIVAGTNPTLGAVGSTATGAIGATFTATGTGTSLAVTVVTGLISIGDTIAGTGVPGGTTILAQISGATGGAGTYTTSGATTSAADVVTSFGTVLKLSAVATGTVAVGQAVTGTGVPAGASIVSQISGAAGGAGLYRISVAATAYAASTAISIASNIILASTGPIALTLAGVGAPWWLTLDLIFDSIAGKLCGTQSAQVGTTSLAAAAIANQVANLLAANEPVFNMMCFVTFSAANAASYATLADFGIE
jgi:hypothetical protein